MNLACLVIFALQHRYPDEFDLVNLTETTVTIMAQYNETCIEISAYDDMIVEGLEMFYITVMSDDPLDVVSDNTSVTIMDNDGRFS